MPRPAARTESPCSVRKGLKRGRGNGEELGGQRASGHAQACGCPPHFRNVQLGPTVHCLCCCTHLDHLTQPLQRARRCLLILAEHSLQQVHQAGRQRLRWRGAAAGVAAAGRTSPRRYNLGRNALQDLPGGGCPDLFACRSASKAGNSKGRVSMCESGLAPCRKLSTLSKQTHSSLGTRLRRLGRQP